MISKGRSKFDKIGGGVRLLVKKDSRFLIEELNVDSKDAVAEDIAIFRLDYYYCFFHDASGLLANSHRKSFMTEVIVHYSIF